MEKAPDKIYVPIVNLGIEEGEHPAPLWWNKDKKSEHPDVVGTIGYIRKDTLLEWLNKQLVASAESLRFERNKAFADVIDKINSL